MSTEVVYPPGGKGLALSSPESVGKVISVDVFGMEGTCLRRYAMVPELTLVAPVHPAVSVSKLWKNAAKARPPIDRTIPMASNHVLALRKRPSAKRLIGML